LGSSAALPTTHRYLSSQVVQAGARLIMVDCGEGTQYQCIRYGMSMHKIDMVLISHLHGDHFYGLIGLLGSMHMVGRTQTLQIYAPPDLADVIRLQLKVSNTVLRYELVFVALPADSVESVFEDDTLTIQTIPLRHRIKPCNGFLLREKVKKPNIIPQILPADTPKEVYITLKQSKDVLDVDGKVLYKWEDYTYIPPSYSYAYCSDTIYNEAIVPIIQGVDVLYHEATFLQEDLSKAIDTYHTTARQAAQIALLAGVKQLIIGHISARYHSHEPHLEEARAVFANTSFAIEGETFWVRQTS